MTRNLTILTAFFLIFGLCGGASASLIGDEVYVDYIVKDVFYESLSGSGTVDEGMESPEVEISFYYDVFFDSNSMRIDFTYRDRFEDTEGFSGIAIRDLNDTDNPDWIVLGVEVETEMAGWTDDRLVYDETGHFVGFNWAGLETTAGESFTALFEFGPNPIPLPATMVLFVTGLVGFMAYRRFYR
jgi:hypothetical protein